MERHSMEVRALAGLTWTGATRLQGVLPRLLLALATIGPSAASGAQTCGAATVWAAPRVVHYRTVVRDDGERSNPDLTVFVEPADGSAAEVDPGSATLNGIPALPGPTAVGDANGNGIPDLMVKFSRGALVAADGLLRVGASTAGGGCVAGEGSVEMLCLPSAVERSDYFIDFTTSEMPDWRLNGLTARLHVRRVKPVYPRGCQDLSPVRAVVLVHGRSIPARAVFDLQYQDYSLMERLAMRGIDTFAADHLGFGFSKIVDEAHDPMLDACNASLRECTLVGQICTPAPGEIPGVDCDCQGLPRIQRMGQQGMTRYLKPNPLDPLKVTAPCPHGSSVNFQAVTDQVRQLALVVDYALAKTGLAKVHLLGLSFGGPVIGKYLGDPDNLSNQDKVAGAIFLASTFGGTQMPEEARTTFPLAVMDRSDTMANFNPVCPGQLDPELANQLWAAIQANDPVGPHWGPQTGPSGGLSRYPVVPRFQWTAAVTPRIAVPALVMNGLVDSVVPASRSVDIYSSLGSARKAIVQLDCASHLLLLEDCSGEGCVAPRLNVRRIVGDWVLTGMVFASPGHASGSFRTAADGTLVRAADPPDQVGVGE